jgi:hypothetical protein
VPGTRAAGLVIGLVFIWQENCRRTAICLGDNPNWLLPLADAVGTRESAQDHNQTLVILYAAIGSLYTYGLIASPWIIAQNFRRPGQIPSAIAVFGIVFLLALFFWSLLSLCIAESVSAER